jgi:putative sigma-54 modulation protein
VSTTEKNVSFNITFRNTEATDAIRQHTTEKLSHTLKKFVHHDTEVHVVLTIEKNRQIAEASFHADGSDFACKEESKDLYTSIDMLAHSLSNLLRKHKEKLTEHHSRAAAER